MTTKNKLAIYCHSEKTLTAYLEEKASNHQNYKVYSSLRRIQEMCREKCIYVGMTKKWNDKIDRLDFKDDDNVYFVKCFSFSKSENIAMWMLYSSTPKEKNGACISYSKEVMKAFKSISKAEIGKFDDGNFKKVGIVPINTVFLTDVLYKSSENTGNYTIKRSDERVENVQRDIVDKIRFRVKNYPWSYENECRLILEVKNEDVINFSSNDDLFIKLPICNDDFIKNINDRITLAPNFVGKETDYKRSGYTGLLDWDLCNKCEKNKVQGNV